MTNATACPDREILRLHEDWCAWYWSMLAAVELPAAVGVLAAAGIEFGMWAVPETVRDLAPMAALLLLAFASLIGWRITATVRAVVRAFGLKPNERTLAAVLWPFAARGADRSRPRALRCFILFLVAIAGYLLAGALLLGRSLPAS